MVGIDVVAPYIHNDVRSLSLAIPVDCLRSSTHSGKDILRELLKDLDLYIVAERVKAPAESGAGTDVINCEYMRRILTRLKL